MRVDAHHHIWSVARDDYGWLTPDLPIHRDYTLDDLRPLLGDIEATVLVQAAPTEAETSFLLNAARNSAGLVRGVIGWEDFTASDASARIEAVAGDPLLKGLRPMLQDLPADDWILQDAVRPALQVMAEADLCFEALVRPRHLPVVLRLAARYPDLRIVIDHAAKPDIAGHMWQPWADDLARLARETNAVCKLSGLVTEAEEGWSTPSIKRYVDYIIGCFGPDRVMWGSDWPVVELAGGYSQWREASLQLLAGVPDNAQAAILGNTAATFYRLDE